MAGETIKKSVAEPESQALKRLTFASNASTNSGPNASSGGVRNSEEVGGERPSASGTFLETPTSSRQGSAEQESLPDDAGNVEDRMKRWADRREQKKKQAALRKKLGVEAKKKDPTAPTQGKGVEGDTVQDLLIEKGLPIIGMESIGSGNFASVYKGMWTEDGPDGTKKQSVVAVKVMKKMQSPKIREDGTPIPPKWLEREVKTNLTQCHDNLVRVIESSVDSLPYAIVLEYCPGGSLHDSIIGDPSTTLHRFTWEHRLKAALDIAQGMMHLHEQNIVHRDLKTLNVLLLHPVMSPSDPVLAKVCDFGLARYLPNDDIQTRLTHQVGSWYYMAPEMFDSKNTYDGKVDVYSYAVLLYEILAGNLYYASDKSKSFGTFVMWTSDGGRPREDAIPEAAPQLLQVLMKEGWRAQPSERPEFREIAERLRKEIPLELSPGRSILCSIASWVTCLSR